MKYPQQETHNTDPPVQRNTKTAAVMMLAGLLLAACSGKSPDTPSRAELQQQAAIETALKLPLSVLIGSLSTQMSAEIINFAKGDGNIAPTAAGTLVVSVLSRDGTSGMTTEVKPDAQGNPNPASAMHVYYFRGYNQDGSPTSLISSYTCLEQINTAQEPQWIARTNLNNGTTFAESGTIRPEHFIEQTFTKREFITFGINTNHELLQVAESVNASNAAVNANSQNNTHPGGV